MTISYTMNPEGARAAVGAQRIGVSGAYTGKITRAEAITSARGSEGIEMTFEADDGSTADFLTLWTVNNSGKELYGRRQLDALMACMKTRSITAKEAVIEKWVDGNKAQVRTSIFPDLMNRPIGLVLQRAPYQKRDGSEAWKMEIVTPFVAVGEDARKVSLEVMNREPATRLDKIIAQLRDRPIQSRPEHGGSAPQQPTRDFDDESIPF